MDQYPPTPGTTSRPVWPSDWDCQCSRSSRMQQMRIFDLGTGDFGFERMELSGGWATEELREAMNGWARTALAD